MAKYWVGATDTWDGTAGLKWATSSGGAGGAAIPAGGDDVYFDQATTVCTIGAAYTPPTLANIFFTDGTLDTNGRSFTVNTTFSITGANARTLTLGASTITLSGSATIWDATTTTNLTFNPNTSTLLCSGTGAGTRIFIGGGLTYNNLTLTSSGGTSFTIQGSNTFNVFTESATVATTVTFVSGATNTFSSFVAVGTASKRYTFVSSVASSATTWSDASGANDLKYVTLTDITATGGAIWYAYTTPVFTRCTGFTYKYYAFETPPAQVVNLVATPAAGGSLAASTTYYYRVFATDVGAAYWGSGSNLNGAPSAQVSATTTTTDKTINLTWDAVAGANGYVVYRTTTSLDYSGNKRCHVANSWYPTVTTNSFSDTGASQYVSTSLLVARESKMPLGGFPLGLEPRTNGIGRLYWAGGLSSDPVTFQNIVDWMVANGYGNWAAGNSNNFAFACSVIATSAVENTFTSYRDVVHMLDSLTFDTSTGGSYVFGSIDSDSTCRRGIRIFQWAEVTTIDRRCAVYDVDWKAMAMPTDSTWYESTLYDTATAIYAPPSIDGTNKATIDGVGTFSLGRDVPMENYYLVATNYVEWNLVSSVQWKIFSKKYTSGIYGSVGRRRFDQWKVVDNSSGYQVSCADSMVGKYYEMIDCFFPNTANTNKLIPIVRWASGNDATTYVMNRSSVLLQVTDSIGTAIPNARVIFKDNSGNILTDYSGTALNLLTDVNGWFMMDTASVTSTTNNPPAYLDTAKAWTTNAWVGRNIYVENGAGIGTIKKVYYNTATTMTLCSGWSGVALPVAGDEIGIIPEVPHTHLTHIIGSGAGTGAAYTTTTSYTPWNIEIYKTGYVTKKLKYTPVIPGLIPFTVALEPRRNVTGEISSN